MELLETIRNRKSARAYTGEPVPRDVVEQILRDAANAPSAINMQPWEVHAVMGEERALLSRRLQRAFTERTLTCGPGTSKTSPDTYMNRSRECAKGMTPLVEEMGSDFKTYINEGSLNFYGAPVALLIFLDDAFPAERMVDIGTFTAYLVMSAAGHGLGTCPIGLVTSYQDDIKDHLNIPESKLLVISVALGKPDPEAPINRFDAPRADCTEFVRWID